MLCYGARRDFTWCLNTVLVNTQQVLYNHFTATLGLWMINFEWNDLASSDRSSLYKVHYNIL